MFEDKSELLKGHIAFFKETISGEETDIDELEIETRLEDCENDIRETRSNIPYDEVDMDEEPIEDFSGDNLEEGELEDEIVEIEAIIDELEALMHQVREYLFENQGDEKDNSISMPSTPTGYEDFNHKLESWLVNEIVIKYEHKGTAISENAAIRKAEAIILGAKHRGDFLESASHAQNDYPEHDFTTEELRQADLFSPGLFHIAFEMIKSYELLGYRMNFEDTLALQRDIWKNLI